MLYRAILFGVILLGSAFHADAQGVYQGVSVRIYAPNPLPPLIAVEEIDVSLGPNMTYGFTLMTIDNNLILMHSVDSLGGVGANHKIVNDGQKLDFSGFQSLPSGLPYQMTLGQPFLLGFEVSLFHTDSQGMGFFSPDRYGWAGLEYTSSGMVLLDNEIATSGYGIIAGTTTIVPEPSAICLAMSATIGLILYRRRCSGL